jgi:lysozyme
MIAWLLNLLFPPKKPVIERKDLLMSDNTRHINQAGLDLIKHFEGLRLEAYPDPATGGEPVTIGYGHTGGVKMGDKIDQAKADEYLKQDCEKFEKHVSEMVTVEINDNQFAALVSFAYNVGPANLKSSTLLKLLNSKASNEDVGAQFLRWNKAQGKEMPGLTKRRNAEKELFLLNK